MSKHLNITKPRYELFLAELAKDGIVSRATRVAGLDRSHTYQRRLRNPEFAQAWSDAIDTATDALEEEARRRAIEGHLEPVIYQGNVTYLYRRDADGHVLLDEYGKPILDLDERGQPKVLTVRKPSDVLMALFLKAKRKEFADHQKVELTGADGAPVQIEETPLVAARKIAFALALGLQNAPAAAGLADDGLDLC